MILTRTVAPAALPVEDAKAHMRVLHDAEDQLIAVYLAAALQELDGPEGILGRCIGPQTWQVQLAGWSDVIVLPVEPVRTVAISYDDPAGDPQALPTESYALETGVGIRPRVRWLVQDRPELADVPWPVRVTVGAGFAQVPDDLLAAIWLRAADLYERREASGPAMQDNPAWAALIARHRQYL